MKETPAAQRRDYLSGSLWDKLLFFAIPLAISSLLQQLFNSADVAVVGHFAGKEALAAVGSNNSIINLLVNLFVGLSVGANVMIARYIGQGDREHIHRAVHTSILVALVTGVILAVVGVAVSRPMLEAMGSPIDVIDLSTLYLRIYFLGMPFNMLYNFEAAILRSKGDTKRPLYCLIIAGIVNVVLNLFFVIVLHMSVAGVAIATVMSQLVSSLLLFIILRREEAPMRLDLKQLQIDWSILKQIARIGMPAGMQGMVFSVSNIVIQMAMNQLGSTAIAATSAALNFEFYVYFLMNAFGQACVTFIGQNYGAGKLDRCVRSTRWAFLLGGIATSGLILLFVFFADPLVFIFTDDPAVAELAILRIQVIVSFEWLNLISEILSGTMRGYGRSLVPALISVLGVCGVRILYIFTYFRAYPTFGNLSASYPISWAITSSALILAYLWCKGRIFRQAQSRRL